MNLNTSKRFTIIGLPGSGKSTFAIKLGKVLNIPVHHLDKHMFVTSGKKREREELLSIEQEMVKEESWIIEGCSISTLHIRFARTDKVIYFRFPRLLCVWRIVKRLFEHDKNLADTESSKIINWRLLKYIWNFDKEKRAEIEKLREKYPHVDFQIFRSVNDVNKYMNLSK